MKKLTKQEIIIEALNELLNQVKDGEFGKENDFDRYAFEDSFSDDVLIWAYIYD